MTRISLLSIINSLLKGHRPSIQTSRIFQEFITLENITGKILTVSSDSARNKNKDYLRWALYPFRREEIIRLFSRPDFHALNLDKFMFSNSQDPCFGIGLSTHQTGFPTSRVKLYNFYDLSLKRINVPQHLKTLCQYSHTNPFWIKKDLGLLNEIWFSGVDLYHDGTVGLKIYSKHILTKNLFTKYLPLLGPAAQPKYQQLFNSGHLPKIGIFCIRYYNKTRFARVDFVCNTRHVLPYLDKFDLNGAARRLYQSFANEGFAIKLTMLAIDLNHEARTQFYFDVYAP